MHNDLGQRFDGSPCGPGLSSSYLEGLFLVSHCRFVPRRYHCTVSGGEEALASQPRAAERDASASHACRCCRGTVVAGRGSSAPPVLRLYESSATWFHAASDIIETLPRGTRTLAAPHDTSVVGGPPVPFSSSRFPLLGFPAPCHPHHRRSARRAATARVVPLGRWGKSIALRASGATVAAAAAGAARGAATPARSPPRC